MRPSRCTFGYGLAQRLWVLTDDVTHAQLGTFACRSSEDARRMVAELVRAGARVRLRDADGRYLSRDAEAAWLSARALER